VTDRPNPKRHIVLTSHPPTDAHRASAISWGAQGPEGRGPVVGTLTTAAHRNVIGTHSGAYSLYRALAVASGTLDPVHKPDLTNTSPPVDIGPFPQWSDPAKIVSLDPYGHRVSEVFAEELADGVDVRPTIAVTRARINMPELRAAIAEGRLKPDGVMLSENGDVSVTKAAVEPVWYLPGIAERCQVSESELRRTLFEQAGNMFPELVTRSDLKVFLPPIGGFTAYIVGDITALWDDKRKVACRIHDECNGSDVFGSDICTCRPYLVHGIEVCIETAQQGGAGLIVYNRKEGRALGEVTKFLVYNARKRHADGDSAAGYFERTECVAGVQDVRFQELMPDVFHWLGISRIDRFVSMSNMKHDAITRQGIGIGERVPIPDELIPPDAQVEMDAKKAAGYYVDERVSEAGDLSAVKGRHLDDY
jgi:GTP cyclohydrolase II